MGDFINRASKSTECSEEEKRRRKINDSRVAGINLLR
jgi:hypothetical protein